MYFADTDMSEWVERHYNETILSEVEVKYYDSKGKNSFMQIAWKD